jgi:hypothetical protein
VIDPKIAQRRGSLRRSGALGPRACFRRSGGGLMRGRAGDNRHRRQSGEAPADGQNRATMRQREP